MADSIDKTQPARKDIFPTVGKESSMGRRSFLARFGMGVAATVAGVTAPTQEGQGLLSFFLKNNKTDLTSAQTNNSTLKPKLEAASDPSSKDEKSTNLQVINHIDQARKLLTESGILSVGKVEPWPEANFLNFGDQSLPVKVFRLPDHARPNLSLESEINKRLSGLTDPHTLRTLPGIKSRQLRVILPKGFEPLRITTLVRGTTMTPNDRWNAPKSDIPPVDFEYSWAFYNPGDGGEIIFKDRNGLFEFSSTGPCAMIVGKLPLKGK